MVFGPTLSNSAQAADPIAQAAKTVVFGTSNTADGITSIGNYVFRNSVTEADVLPATISTVKAKTGLKNVAVLYGNDDVFTKSGYDNFKKALEDQKIPVTTTETFAKGDVDFKAQLTKIKGTNPDAIVLSALLAEGAPIMVQARQLGINLPVIGGNGMNSVKIFDLAPGGASNNLWIGSPWSIENKSAENVKFIDAYKAKFNGAPDQFAAQSYDAMYIVAQALKNTKISGDLPGPHGTARRAAVGAVDRRHRRLQVPPGQRPRRQARRLRRRPGADRQRDQGRQVRHREVIGTRPLMGMRLARGLDGRAPGAFAGPPQDKNIPGSRPARRKRRGSISVAGALQAEAHPRAQARAIAARRSFRFYLERQSCWNNNSSTPCRWAASTPCSRWASRWSSACSGSSIWRMARFSWWPTRR